MGRKKNRYEKILAGKKYAKGHFKSFAISEEMNVDRIAVFGNIKKKRHEVLAGGVVKTAVELLADIFSGIKDRKLMQSTIPEHLTILRSFQFVYEYKEDVIGALNNQKVTS